MARWICGAVWSDGSGINTSGDVELDGANYLTWLSIGQIEADVSTAVFNGSGFDSTNGPVSVGGLYVRSLMGTIFSNIYRYVDATGDVANRNDCYAVLVGAQHLYFNLVVSAGVSGYASIAGIEF